MTLLAGLCLWLGAVVVVVVVVVVVMVVVVLVVVVVVLVDCWLWWWWAIFLVTGQVKNYFPNTQNKNAS